MSRRKLAEQCNIVPSTMAKWAKHKPSADKLRVVASVLDVSVDWLLGNTDVRKPEMYHVKDETLSKAEGIWTKDEILMESIRKLNESQLDILIAMAEQMKETNPDG